MKFLKSHLKRILRKTGMLQHYYDYYPQKPLYIPTLFSYWRISRWNVYLRFRVRMLYLLWRHGFRRLSLEPREERSAQKSNQLERVVDRNLFDSHLAAPFSRRRTEHLIYILHSIPSVNKQGRLLSIGPRNEGDLVLLQAHGFKKVEAIDLFSYSPQIRLMDMHHMEFPDNSFDLISCGWVVSYSYDIRQCAQEIARVCRAQPFPRILELRCMAGSQNY